MLKLTVVAIPLLMIGCASAGDKADYRDAQIGIVDSQMIARQRVAMERAQAQANWAAAMAAVAAANPESADAIAVGLAVAAVQNQQGEENAPIVTLRREENEVREWAKVLAAPLLNTVTQLGIADINAGVLKNAANNDARVQINEDTIDGVKFQVLGEVANGVSAFGTTAVQSSGGNTTYTLSDDSLIDLSTVTSGDVTSGDTNTVADSYNTSGDTTQHTDSNNDSSDNSDNSDNSTVTNPPAE
jgi:hypothetical protein